MKQEQRSRRQALFQIAKVRILFLAFTLTFPGRSHDLFDNARCMGTLTGRPTSSRRGSIRWNNAYTVTCSSIPGDVSVDSRLDRAGLNRRGNVVICCLDALEFQVLGVDDWVVGYRSCGLVWKLGLKMALAGIEGIKGCCRENNTVELWEM